MTLAGELSEDLIINSYSVSPKTVLVSGAKSVMEKITELKTTEVTLNNLELGDRELETQIVLPELLSLTELEENSIQVSLGISAIKPVVQRVRVPIKFISNGEVGVKPSHREAKIRISYTESKFPAKLESDNFGIRRFC